jgi:hypothetical protein
MFLIEFTTGHESVISFNKMQDDFLRFLPEQFAVEKEQLIVSYVPDYLHEWMKQPDQFIDFSTGLAQKFTIVDSEKVDIDDPIELQKIVTWPYDKDGKFLGNKIVSQSVL